MLANLFNKKNKALLGVDISSTSVKVLELSQKNGRYQVEAYASEALPADAIIERSINNDEAVGETVRRVLTRARAGAKRAAVAVPGSAAMIKIIQMSASLSEDEMDLQIRAEADQYLPFSQEDNDGVALDWEIQGVPSADNDMVEVVLVACRSEAVERRKDAAEYANLEVSVVDVEAFCTERAFALIQPQLSDDAETVAIVDIGATMTTLSVMHEGKSIYTREQMFGGKQLTDAIARHYGLSDEEANRAYHEGTLPDDYELEVLEPFRRSALQQVSRSLQFFYSSSQFNDVDSIVLAGGTSSIPLLADMVQDELGVTTVIANPFVSMTLSNKVNPSILNNDAPSLLVACGLAMRSFD